MICLKALNDVFFVIGLVFFYFVSLSESIGTDSPERDKTTPRTRSIGMDSRERDKTKPRTRLITPKSSPRGPNPLCLLPLPSEYSPRISKENFEQKQSLSQPQTPQSSPRRSPRPRYSSLSNPLSLGELPPSMGITFLRSLTPRAFRLNDYIEERLEEMGKPESGAPFDLWCKKFYQKFKGQENGLSLPSMCEWEKTTDKPLLDQLWKYSIMEYLVDDKIQKFEEKSLEAIGSSVIFLIEELEGQSHSELEILYNIACTIYRHLSTRLSKKLDITGEDISKEECFYHIAKYSTLMKSYAEAWSYLTQCVDLLVWDEEELKWLNSLKEGYINHLKNMQVVEESRYEEFFKVADFLQLMKIRTIELKDNPLDSEILSIWLEGAKDFYQRNLSPEKRLEEIRKLDASIHFPLACTAYRSARGEKEENAKNLLTVSQNGLSILGAGILNHDFIPFIDELLESLSQDDSRLVKLLKAEIFTHMAKSAWNINVKEKAKELYFEAAKILYQTKPHLICPDWNVDILALILDEALHSAPSAIWERMVHGISMNLVKVQYKSRVYLRALKSYMEKEMWVTASRLLERIAIPALVPSLCKLELEWLAKDINKGFEKTQEGKRSLFKNFSEMIHIIIAHKTKPNLRIDELASNWVKTCLITEGQWLVLRDMNKNNFNLMGVYLKSIGEEKNPEFLNLDFKAYADKIYDMFELGEPPFSSFNDVS